MKYCIDGIQLRDHASIGECDYTSRILITMLTLCFHRIMQTQWDRCSSFDGKIGGSRRSVTNPWSYRSSIKDDHLKRDENTIGSSHIWKSSAHSRIEYCATVNDKWLYLRYQIADLNELHNRLVGAEEMKVLDWPRCLCSQCWARRPEQRSTAPYACTILIPAQRIAIHIQKTTFHVSVSMLTTAHNLEPIT